MNRLLSYWNKPYPLEHSWRKLLRMWALSGLFVTLFLYFLRPFGMGTDDAHAGYFLRISFYYGATTFFSLALVDVPIMLGSFLLAERWTLGKEWLKGFLVILVISVANLWLSVWLFDGSASWSSWGVWLRLTISVGIFPMAAGAFMRHQRLQKLYTRQAHQLAESLQAPHPAEALGQIKLTGDNQGEAISLLPAELLYIETADNYVQVHFLQEGKIKTQLLRSTLKKMENALADMPNMYKCHRRYLVNLDWVTGIQGNAQGYRLQVQQANISIPVSRNLNEEIAHKLRGR